MSLPTTVVEQLVEPLAGLVERRHSQQQRQRNPPVAATLKLHWSLERLTQLAKLFDRARQLRIVDPGEYGGRPSASVSCVVKKSEAVALIGSFSQAGFEWCSDNHGEKQSCSPARIGEND